MDGWIECVCVCERERKRGRQIKERNTGRDIEREEERDHFSIYLTSTPTFFILLATAMAVSDVEGDVCAHCTTSSSFITWAGVKKCIPSTYGSLHGRRKMEGKEDEVSWRSEFPWVR
jgi:hypothetical protein